MRATGDHLAHAWISVGKRTLSLGWVAGVFLFPYSLAAQTAAGLAACHDLEDARARLACYDRVSGRGDGVAAIGGDGDQETTVPPGIPANASSTPPDNRALASGPVAGDFLLDQVWGLDEDARRYWYGLYRPNYFLPIRYTNRVNDEPFSPIFGVAPRDDIGLDSYEAKFQLSLKARLWTTDDRRWSIWGAYTQQNQWQVYNGDISRPFRETNYEPELFVTWRPGVEIGGFHWRLLSFGINHQSNGQVDPISRSWDRLFAEAGLERASLVLKARLWTRISESADEDDNPDITDYLGHGQLNVFYRAGRYRFELMARGNIDTGKGAAQLSWYTSPLLGPLRGYVQLFSGYGESMIDYNWNQTTLGAGIVLNDGF